MYIYTYIYISLYLSIYIYIYIYIYLYKSSKGSPGVSSGFCKDFGGAWISRWRVPGYDLSWRAPKRPVSGCMQRRV